VSSFSGEHYTPITPIHAPPPPSEAEAAYKQRQERRDKIRLWLEISVGLIVLVYTVVSIGLWETAQKQLEVSERPWITADLVERGASDFTFLPDGQASFRGMVILKNVGHSPAIGVSLNTYRVIIPSGNAVFTEPVRIQKEICEPLRKIKANPKETVGIAILFPGQQTPPLGMSTSIPKEWIDGGAVTFKDGDPNRYIAPVLVGCVDYRFSFDPEVHHQTGIIYDMGRYDASAPGWEKRLIKVGTNLPPDQMILVRYFFGGNYAD
jgi:hypothetical protein